MKVESLTLRNFRNIEFATFEPDEHLNFFTGSNGQGKTSILEALHCAGALHSFRNSKPIEMIRWDSPFADVQVTIQRQDSQTGLWKNDLKVRFEKAPANHLKALRQAWVDSKHCARSTEYLRHRFHTIVFNPSDHELVRGEPRLRRTYLNQVISAENLDHLSILQKYARLLLQRNALLKKERETGRSESGYDEFTEQLVQYGSQIVFDRLEWTGRMGLLLDNTLRKVAPEQAFLSLKYLQKWDSKKLGLVNENSNLKPDIFSGQPHDASLELIVQRYREEFRKLRNTERLVGTTLVGPHRDDWSFSLGEKPMKGHASQGEIRSALLALKLSEIELFQKRTELKPVFLLDDFSSELDSQRRKFLLEFLTHKSLQVFVTTTEEQQFSGSKFAVRNGKLSSYDRRGSQAEINGLHSR